MNTNKNHRTIIIAEAGVNHNGDINLAKKLVDKAVEAQVDYVKFQIFKTDNIICKTAKKAEYQESTTGENETQSEMLKKLELSFDEHFELKKYCDQKKIAYLNTPFDLDSLHFLLNMGLETIKVPSGEITNFFLLNEIASHEINVILSTGMSTLDEIKEAIKLLNSKNKVKNIKVLHCNTQYPTPMSDVNLNVMNTLKDVLGLEIGYSDHTKGIEVPIAAVALGAVMIEKHFTLDNNLSGPDHFASIEPKELALMVQQIRNIEQALGNKEKSVTQSERGNILIARKFLVASKIIKKGHRFTLDDFSAKRTGVGGISAMQLPHIVGSTAIKDFYPDDVIVIE